jgi:purine-binding chemotaxis protein CheW
MNQYATFVIDANLFGINVLLVREINRNLDITHVDDAPPYVAGLLNLRGQIVTVLDMSVKIGLQKRTIGDASRCIVLKTNAELENHRAQGFDLCHTANDIVGLLADDIGDMVTVHDQDIEQPPANLGGVDGRFLSGVVKLENDLMATVKIDEILDAG